MERRVVYYWEETTVTLGMESRVLACDEMPPEQRGNAKLAYWPDDPFGIDDFGAAREAIVQRLEDMLPTLTAN